MYCYVWKWIFKRNPQVKWEIRQVKIKEFTQTFGKAHHSRKEIHEIEKKLYDLEEKIKNGENSPNICKNSTETNSKVEH